MYTALFFPSSSFADPTRKGFINEDEAWAYVFSTMCDTCQRDRELALAGIDDHFAEMYPVCSAQWEVVKTEELNGYPFASAGLKRVG